MNSLAMLRTGDWRLSAPAWALGLAVALIGLLYLPSFASLVDIWNSSQTFQHGYVILPVSLWLAWRRRAQVAALPWQPWWPGTALVALCGAAWWIAGLADVQVLRQVAVVAMLPAAVLAIFGRAVGAALAFPLAFLLLAVPFGEVFMAPLIRLTAGFTVWAVQASGVPVLRDGANFSLPSGNWSVVEACSGVRYLIASFTLGCVYAYLHYCALWRRLLFVGCAITIPIAANAVRAYLIVMTGHLSGMTLAVGVDHLIFGWFFFALVMLLLYWTGQLWQDGGPSDAAMPGQPARALRAPDARFYGALLGVAAAAMLWPVLVANRPQPAMSRVDLTRFAPTWQTASPFSDWQPDFAPPNASLTRFLAAGAGRAAVTLFYYHNRPHGAGLINSENRLVRRKDPRWSVGDSGRAALPLSAGTLTVRETVLHSASGDLLVWQWYWINGRLTANDYRGKWLQARGQLFSHADDGAAVFLYTPLDGTPDAARAVLRRCAADQLAAIDAALAAPPVSGVPP